MITDSITSIVNMEIIEPQQFDGVSTAQEDSDAYLVVTTQTNLMGKRPILNFYLLSNLNVVTS